MRPFRLLVSLTACVLGITLLFFLSLPSQEQPQLETDAPPEKKTRLGAFFSFHSPSSLFQPSAIISLTDDNSTFFLARPAAFGPLLPSKGLSGPLWIGSGFSDDSFSRSGSISSAEGELGCSDVPGWHDGGGEDERTVSSESNKASKRSRKGGSVSSRLGLKSGKSSASDEDDADSAADSDADDGTDDYLYGQPHSSSSSKKASGSTVSEHADIESMQESAEIAGRVVLLTRGGCGFLEKVKWAQRRGGTAVIVGDDIRGGPLVTMYARGDTSNITIPALFTSHTTAHLLSSLIPSGGLAGGTLRDEVEVSKGLGFESTGYEDPQDQEHTTTKPSTEPTSTSHPSSSKSSSGGRGLFGALASLFGHGSSTSRGQDDSRRPPSSGSFDWVKADWEDEQDSNGDASKKDSTTSTTSGDSFVIGVHDWRDPDLVGADTASNTKTSGDSTEKEELESDGSRSGSIFPGSGEYSTDYAKSSSESSTARDDERGESWWSRIRWSKTSNNDAPSKSSTSDHSKYTSTVPVPTSTRISVPHDHQDALWVTLTPTSMSSSPFFDTLLVLVVSPLVTLTVVYALLLLRSRIRRRRWRAPKSVVDRLPVRTYQTLPSIAASADASGLATPVVPNVTTPLLQNTASSSRPVMPRPRPSTYSITRPRPRSRTASEASTRHVAQPSTSTLAPSPVPEERPTSRDTINSASSSLTTDTAQEKREAGLAEWRRRYGGRQRECVVCLEEYVDGVSRVMSLPCGHEFHAECITPWLTTRRRTCPICKGDVVRSMARRSEESVRSESGDTERSGDSNLRGLGALAGFASIGHVMSGSSFGSRRAPEEEAAAAPLLEEDDVQSIAAVTRNESPSAEMPVPVDDDEIFQGDVESGTSVDRERTLGGFWGLFGGRARRSRNMPDRDR